MKPHVICHMAASVDGRILPSRWRPADAHAVGGLFERLHDQLEGDAWLVGRVTGQEFARREAYPRTGTALLPREAWIAQRDAPAYGVVLDAGGKIAWGRADIGGDPIVVVLTRQVSDAHLAGLRADGVSYIFAGESVLRAGLVDELSLVILPVVDGSSGAPSVFDSSQPDAGAAPVRAMTLDSSETLEGGAVWLRYRLENTVISE